MAFEIINLLTYLLTYLPVDYIQLVYRFSTDDNSLKEVATRAVDVDSTRTFSLTTSIDDSVTARD